MVAGYVDVHCVLRELRDIAVGDPLTYVLYTSSVSCSSGAASQRAGGDSQYCQSPFVSTPFPGPACGHTAADLHYASPCTSGAHQSYPWSSRTLLPRFCCGIFGMSSLLLLGLSRTFFFVLSMSLYEKFLSHGHVCLLSCFAAHHSSVGSCCYSFLYSTDFVLVAACGAHPIRHRQFDTVP